MNQQQSPATVPLAPLQPQVQRQQQQIMYYNYVMPKIGDLVFVSYQKSYLPGQIQDITSTYYSVKLFASYETISTVQISYTAPPFSNHKLYDLAFKEYSDALKGKFPRNWEFVRLKEFKINDDQKKRRDKIKRKLGLIKIESV